MLTKNIDKNRNQIQMVTIEDLVPEDHLVRDLDKAIDFSFIYDIVKDLYCEDNGRPSIDPVCLFKILFTQYIFGIRSLRQTITEIEVNMAYKWFVGLDLLDSVPHFSTISKNYERRFKNTDIFVKIFERILDEAIRCKFVKPETVFIDSTHVKASANKNKKEEVYITKEAKKYKHTLDKEIREDREEHNKKPLKDNDDDGEEENKITRSTTDPESGEFHKGEHEKMFAYSAHTVCDKNNFILETVVTPANIHDSVMFDEIYKRVKGKYKSKNYVMDAGYKTPWIMKQVIDDNNKPIIPYTRQKGKKGVFRKNEYVYDEYYDCYICPNGERLEYSTTTRDGYKQYKSRSKTCDCCEQRELCTKNKKHEKLITRHIWSKYLEEAEEIRYTEEGKKLYKQRSTTIERVFADAKEKHGMRYTQLRGLAKVTASITLIFACMNLKKIAKWKKKNGEKHRKNSFLETIKFYIQEKTQKILIKRTKPILIYA